MHKTACRADDKTVCYIIFTFRCNEDIKSGSQLIFHLPPLPPQFHTRWNEFIQQYKQHKIKLQLIIHNTDEPIEHKYFMCIKNFLHLEQFHCVIICINKHILQPNWKCYAVKHKNFSRIIFNQLSSIDSIYLRSYNRPTILTYTFLVEISKFGVSHSEANLFTL